MASSRVIGRVSVKVMPDTRQFRDKLQRQLDDAERKQKLNLNVQLDEKQLKTEALGRLRELNQELKDTDRYKVKFRSEIDTTGQLAAVKKARKELQAHATAWTRANSIKFRGELDAVEGRVELNKESLNHVERQLNDWAKKVSPLKVYVAPELALGTTQYVKARLDVLTRPRAVIVSPMLNYGAVARVSSVLAALSGGRAVWDVGENLWDSIKDLDKAIPKITGVTLGLTNLSAWAMTAASNLLSVSASLAAIAPAGLALPGLFGGMAIGLGASVAALKDFNKELPRVKSQLSEMQNVISASFWDEARNPMARFFNKLMPQITDNLDRTGSSLGGFFGSLSNSFVGVFDGQIRQMFDDLNESVDIASKYTDNFAGIIATLGRVGAASLPELSRWFGEISKDFDKFLSEAEADGRLDQWIDNGVENLKALGRTLKATGSTLSGLARAAERAGGSTLQSLADRMESVAETVNGDTFQGALTRAFRGAHRAMDELVDGSGAEFESLMLRVSDIIGESLPVAGRAAGKALGAIFGALDQAEIQDTVLGLFENIEHAVDNLAPHMPALARALASVVDVVGEVAVSVSKVLAPAIEHIAPKIEELADIIGPLATLLGDVLGGAVDGVGTALGAIPAEVLLASAAMIGLNRSSTVLATGQQKLNGRIAATQGAIKGFRENIGTVATSMLTAGARTERESARMKSAVNGITPALKGVAKGGAALAGVGLIASGTADKFGLTNAASMALMGTIAGPWGAAIMGGAGLLMDMAKQGQQVADIQDALTQSFDIQTQTLGEYVAQMQAAREAAANLTSDHKEGFDGWLKTMVSPGLWDDVVKDIVGVDNAFSQAADGAAKNREQISKLKAEFSALGFKIGELKVGETVDLDRLGDVANRVAPAMKALGISVDDLANADTTALVEMENQIADWLTHADSAAGRNEELAASFANVSNSADTTSQAATRLGSAMQAVLSPSINAEQATMRWQESLRTLKSELNAEAGLKGFTQGATSNKEAVIGAVQSLQSMIVTSAEAGATSQQLATKLANGKKAILDQAAAAGMSRREVGQYLKVLGLTPDIVRTVLQAVGVTKEERRVAAYHQAMKGLPKALKTKLEAVNFPVTRKRIRDLAADYEKHPRRVQTEILAIVKTARRDLKGTQDDMAKLDRTLAQPKVETVDKATKKNQSIDQGLTRLGKKYVEPTVGLIDEASVKIGNIISRLDTLDGRVVTTTVNTKYTTTGRPGGATPRAAGRQIVDPFEPLSRSAAKTAEVVARTFKRLSDSVRNSLVKQADGWLLTVQSQTVKAENEISKSLTQARNKVSNLETKLSRQVGKEAKARVKRELDAAKGQEKRLKKLSKGWKDQAREVGKAVKKYEQINNELLTATAELDSLNERIQSFKDGLVDTYYGIASILEAPMSTFASMEKHLESQIKNFSEFRDGLASLTNLGLSQTVIDQLAAEGPEALDFIKSILKEGQTGVDRLNDLWGQLEGIAGGTADLVGDYVFFDELQMAEDKVDSLLATLQDMKPKIESATKALMNAIGKGVKVKRKQITKDLDAIISRYRRFLNVANQATQTNTPGLLKPVVAGSSGAAVTNNDNRVYNINISAKTGGSSESDLFTAANRVKAVIATA